MGSLLENEGVERYNVGGTYAETFVELGETQVRAANAHQIFGSLVCRLEDLLTRVQRMLRQVMSIVYKVHTKS